MARQHTRDLDDDVTPTLELRAHAHHGSASAAAAAIVAASVGQGVEPRARRTLLLRTITAEAVDGSEGLPAVEERSAEDRGRSSLCSTPAQQLASWHDQTLLAVIEHKPTVRKILEHLGLESEPPAFAAPRGPPLLAGLEASATGVPPGVEADAGRRVVVDLDFVEPAYG